eukprot:m.250811 g.250811  ORF g.250811 m.250811 type:complete len:431 (-) comp19533_c0_seq1:171-1463(-)
MIVFNPKMSSNSMGVLSPEKGNNSLPSIASQSHYRIETSDDESVKDGGDSFTRYRYDTAKANVHVHRPSTAPIPLCDRNNEDSDELTTDAQSSASKTHVTIEDVRAKARRLLVKSAKCRKRTAQVCQHIEVQTRDKRSVQQREEARLAVFNRFSTSARSSARPMTSSGASSAAFSQRLQPLSIDFAKLLDDKVAKPTKSSVAVVGTMAQREELRRQRKEAERREQDDGVDAATKIARQEEANKSDLVRRNQQAKSLVKKRTDKREGAKGRESVRTQAVLKKAASIYGSTSTTPRAGGSGRTAPSRPQTHHGARAEARVRGSASLTRKLRDAEGTAGSVMSCASGGDPAPHHSHPSKPSKPPVPLHQTAPSDLVAGNEKPEAEEKAEALAAATAAAEAERAMLETMAQRALAETRGFAEAKLAAIAEHRGR